MDTLGEDLVLLAIQPAFAGLASASGLGPVLYPGADGGWRMADGA